MHRFSDSSTFEWVEFMKELEDLFCALYPVAEKVIADSAVAECDRLKKMTCWISELEIDTMTIIFTFGKIHDETEQEKQQPTTWARADLATV